MQRYGLQDIPVENFEEETLGLMPYVESLSDFILKCETPLTIAIQGDWGSGKTSLMNPVRSQLQANPNVQTTWFNTWQYSQFGLEDELAISLLSHFLDKLDADENAKKVLLKIKSGVRKLTKYLPTVAGMVGGGIGEDLAQKLIGILGDEETDPARQITGLKGEIEKTVKRKIGDDNETKIVVFIDDLDRLLPIKAVELLEIFKLFMDIRGCVYVLACDYEVVSQGLKQKFGLGTDKLRGRSFFDKIIQLPFNMPMGQYDVINYLKSLLTKIGVEYKEEDLVDYKELVDESVSFNPRSMKRLFNLMLLLNEVAKIKNLFDEDGKKATKRDKQRILFAILCLQTAFEPIYDEISKKIEMNLEMLFRLSSAGEYEDKDVFEDSRSRENFEKHCGSKLNDSDGSKMIRLKSFIQIFYRSIQIDQDKAVLSHEEWTTLKQMFSLSAITSMDSGRLLKDYSKVLDYKESGEKLAKILRIKCRDQFQVGMKHWKHFRCARIRGRKDSGIRIELPFIHLEPKFTLEFVFERGFMASYMRGGKAAARRWTQWFIENCADSFPEKTTGEDERFLQLLKVEFESGFTEEEQFEKFKEAILEAVSKIIPKLVKEEKKLLKEEKLVERQQIADDSSINGAKADLL